MPLIENRSQPSSIAVASRCTVGVKARDGRRLRGPRTSSSCRAKLTTVVFRIRATLPDDAAGLQQVERCAGERFREVDLFAVAITSPCPWRSSRNTPGRDAVGSRLMI